MKIVLDASITAARLFPDEQTPMVKMIFNNVDLHGAVVPPLWRSEMANVLQMQVRKQRLSLADRDAFLSTLRSYNIDVDSSCELHLP